MFTNNSNRPVVQIIGASAIIMWSLLVSLVFFYGLHYLKILRVGEILEIVGLDYHEINLV